MPVKLDRYMRVLKYLLLFAAVYLTMTTSELFCKEFDPYFASVNLFKNTDITLYFAIPAFIITMPALCSIDFSGVNIYVLLVP